MKTGFNDPAKIKNQRPMNKPQDGKKSPWDFTCPEYDQRSSCFVNAGTHYGVGINQPVGQKGNPKMKGDTIPFGRLTTLKTDEVG